MIKFVSDVHLEDRSFITESYTGEDLFIIGGDLAPYTQRDRALSYIEAYLASGGRHVMYIMGNHEYYGSSINEVDAYWMIKQRHNITVCTSKSKCVYVNQKAIIGVTLWCDVTECTPWMCDSISDFKYIKGFTKEREVELHKQSLSTLMLELCDKTDAIVVTHHAPCKGSSFKYLDEFFYNKMTVPGNVKLWLHGHTHEATSHGVVRSYKDGHVVTIQAD